MNRTQQLDEALRDLMATSADIEACAVVTEDGLIIASALPQGMDEDQVAGISSVMISMGERICAELNKNELEQLFVRGKDGYVIMSHAGPHAVLVALTRKEAKLGLIFLDMSRAADKLAEIIA